MKITGLMTIATITATLAGGVALAETASVSRCNFTEGTAYKPGLWITKDGVTRLVKVDEEGLTRRIIFDDKLATEYVRAQMGGDGGSANVSITNSCSGSTYSYSAEEDVIIVADVEAPTECGPVECGPVDCGPVECGPVDCGPVDCGPVDCGPTDCGAFFFD